MVNLLGCKHCLVSNNNQITLLDCTTCFLKTMLGILYEFQLIYNLNVFHLMSLPAK